MKVLTLILALVAVFAVACGSSGPDCNSTSKTLCAKACACNSGGKCAIGDSAGNVSFNSLADCETLYAFGCSQAKSSTRTIDWAACDTALGSAQCVDSSGGIKALAQPASCH